MLAFFDCTDCNQTTHLDYPADQKAVECPLCGGTTIKRNAYPDHLDTTFGIVKVIRSFETGRLHAVTFGIERDTAEELLAEVERLYYLPQPEVSNAAYAAGYACASGYWD